MFRAQVQRWRRAGRVALILALAGLAGGCSRGGPAAPPRTVSDWFTIRVGDQPVRMQIAVTEAEMARGLMERRDLAPDQGMLFVYGQPQALSFWMRDTPLPLDIGYFDATGALREIYQMQPNDDTKIASRGRDLQFALEMNQGWYLRNGVKPGAKLDLAAVKQALRARGFELKRFGLE